MIRLDRQRLERARYGAAIEIATRIGDVDVQGHVNNVAVAAILQEARGRFDRRLLAAHLVDGHGLVVGGLAIEYAGELTYPEPVAVSVGVIEIGRSSFVLGTIARQHGRIAVYGEATLIVTRAGRSTAIPAAMRAALESALIADVAADGASA